MAGETMELKVVVDAVMASDQLKQLNARISELEVNAKKAGAAMPALEKSTGMAAQKMLILGQFVDDAQYGLRGVVNNMPQVTQAFGGSLGLAGGVGIAAVAVSQLYDAWKAYDAIQQEVASNMGAWRGALADVDKALREGVNKRTTDLTQALKDAQTELRNFGKTSREIAEDEGKIAIAMTERQLASLEKNLPGLREKAKPKGRSQGLSALQIIGVQDVFTEEEKEDFKAQSQILADATARRENLTKQLDEQRKALEELAKVNKAVAAKEAAAEAAPGIKENAKKRADSERQAEIDKWKTKTEIDKAARKEQLAQIEEDRKLRVQQIEEERKAREDAEKERTRIVKEQAKERAEAEKKAAKEKADAIKAAEKSTAEFQIGIGQTVASQLMSTSQGYIEAKIKGEKDAEQKAIASFLSATGQQLVASGTRAIFEGAIMSANPLTPGMGAGMIATGVAAIGVGLTMGGVGTAMTPPAETKGAGGASRDRGASPRSSRGGGDGGGPLVINVSYGVGGPLPEDTAREISRVMRTGDRRRGAA